MIYEILRYFTILIMSCNKLVNDSKCGKCVYSLLSYDFIRNKSLLKIVQIATNISWNNEFSNYKNSSSTHLSINIDCAGTIYIDNVRCETITTNLTKVKNICATLIQNWYSYHKEFKLCNSYQYVSRQVQLIKDAISISKVRTLLVELTYYIKDIVVCEGRCTTVVRNKERGICMFPLSDTNKIATFTLEGILDMFDTILQQVKDISHINMGIDFNSAYVTCTGDIVSTKGYISCTSAIKHVVNNYTFYLKVWCSANQHREEDIKKVNLAIKKMQRAKSLSTIYEISNSLSDPFKF